MRILLSSKWLCADLETFRTRNIKITHWLITDDKLNFLNGDEQIAFIGITKARHCPTLKESPAPYIEAQWNNIREAICHFPEQPIVMQFEEEKITISQCELWFDNNGLPQYGK